MMVLLVTINENKDAILIQTRPEIQTEAEANFSVWTGFTPISKPKPITPTRHATEDGFWKKITKRILKTLLQLNNDVFL